MRRRPPGRYLTGTRRLSHRRSPTRPSTTSTTRCCCVPRRRSSTPRSRCTSRLLEIGGLDDSGQALVERLIANHQAVADEMGALTEAEGGVAWECTNPWLDDRLIDARRRGDQDERRPDPRRPQPGRRAREPRSVDAPGPVGRVVVAGRQDSHPRGRHAGVAAVGGDRRAHSGRRRLHQPRGRRRGRPDRPDRAFPTPMRSPAGSVPSARPN